MTYRVEIIIDEKRDVVAVLYVNLMRMSEWELGLKSIEHKEGRLFETGSRGIFHFEFSGQHMPMKVCVEENHLPEQIIQIFEVPGAWNRCDNRFVAEGDQTRWIMDVTFNFDKPINISEDRFIEKTTTSMNVFKSFVEKEKTV